MLTQRNASPLERVRSLGEAHGVGSAGVEFSEYVFTEGRELSLEGAAKSEFCGRRPNECIFTGEEDFILYVSAAREGGLRRVGTLCGPEGRLLCLRLIRCARGNFADLLPKPSVLRSIRSLRLRVRSNRPRWWPRGLQQSMAPRCWWRN